MTIWLLTQGRQRKSRWEEGQSARDRNDYPRYTACPGAYFDGIDQAALRQAMALKFRNYRDDRLPPLQPRPILQ